MDLLNPDFSATVIGLFLGVGLAAASGFRVFLPLFVLSVAIYFKVGDYLDLGVLSENFSWLGSDTAVITLGIATLMEIFAYYIPFVDNLLDALAIPLAAVAGTLLVVSQLSEMPEVINWGLAIIAGGGTATVVSSTMATARAASSGATAGTGNFILSSLETVMALFMSLLSFLLPLIAFILAVVILSGTWFFYRSFRKKKLKSK